MKKVFLFLISLLIGIILFIWIARTVGLQEIKDAFLVFTGWKGIIILLLTVLIALLSIWKWKEILKGIEVNISAKELLRPYLAGFSLMFLAPIIVLGGELFRAYILREKNSIPWPKGMASVIIDRILEWTANLIIIFFGSIFFLFTIGFPSVKLVLIFGGVFLIFLLGISLFYFKSAKRESILRFIIRSNNSQPFDTEKEIFKFFKFNNPAVWKSVVISFVRAAAMYARIWLLIVFLGKNLALLPTLSILGFTYLAAMIPIPTSLGSHEAIQTFAFQSLRLGSSTATAFTMIIRGAELIIALVGLVILFRLGVDLMKTILFKKAEKLADPNL